MKRATPLLILALTLTGALLAAKTEPAFHVRGRLTYNGKPLAAVAVGVRELNLTTFTDEKGEFDLYPVKRGVYALAVSHPKTKSEVFDIYVKRDFRIEKSLGDDVPLIRSQPMQPPFFAPTSSSYDSGKTVEKAVTLVGLSPQYYTFLPASAKMGVLFEPPVIRSQNPMLNSYVADGLVMDMPFHSLGLYSTANLRHTDGVRVSRGVYAVTERDAQGAALVETFLPAGKEGRNGFDFYINPAIADAAGHYQISDKAWGSVAVRRTILEGYFAADSAVPAAIDYQSKNIFRFNSRNYLEIVALGADDSIPLTSTQKFGSRAHAQKVKYRHLGGPLVYELEFKNRSFEQNYVVLGSKKNITSVTPRIGLFFAKDHYAEVGTDLFYEGSSAQLFQGQNIGGLNLDILKNYNIGGYDGGKGVAFGGYLLYRGKIGRFGAELSSRLDKYREYDTAYSANAIQLYYEFMPGAKIYAGGANTHRRPEPYKLISVLPSPALAPESNYKAEAGVGFTPFPFLKVNTTVFYTRWSNLIALRTDTVGITDISNTSIYRNSGSSENTGVELSAILQYKNYYLRSSYTYQYMPGDDNFSFYYRRHIANAALIYLSGMMAHTVQLKVWSLPGDIAGAKDDSLNPVVQLDYRWSIQSDTGVFFTAEIGQILNAPWKYLADPHRKEYYDTSALGNAFLGLPTKGTATEESLPVHLNLAAGMKL